MFKLTRSPDAAGEKPTCRKWGCKRGVNAVLWFHIEQPCRLRGHFQLTPAHIQSPNRSPLRLGLFHVSLRRILVLSDGRQLRFMNTFSSLKRCIRRDAHERAWAAAVPGVSFRR